MSDLRLTSRPLTVLRLTAGWFVCLGVKRARSCTSVSRMRAVISCECNNALVKIFGGVKLKLTLAKNLIGMKIC